MIAMAPNMIHPHGISRLGALNEGGVGLQCPCDGGAGVGWTVSSIAWFLERGR